MTLPSIIFSCTDVGGDVTRQGFFSGLGGAIYNRGDIVVEGESYFSLNTASVNTYSDCMYMSVDTRVVFVTCCVVG